MTVGEMKYELSKWHDDDMEVSIKLHDRCCCESVVRVTCVGANTIALETDSDLTFYEESDDTENDT